MITRNRIKKSEKQVEERWQRLLGKELRTEGGKRLRVIYPGRANGDSGPDFRDVIIAMNESNLVKGDIEIHVKSSDWYRHGHHTNPEYNNVILHVVMWHDCDSATLTQNGKVVPVLPLSFGYRAYSPPYRLPCFQIMKRRGKQSLKKLLDIAGEERFKQKAINFQARLQQEEVGEVLFQGMMRALGYSKNTRPFEELACKMPLNFLESRESLAIKQALLLGTAGLLPSQRLQGKSAREKEVQELEQIWRSVGKEAKTMSEKDWHLFHVYPNNSPVRRIAAQSYLLQRYYDGGLLIGIFQLVKGASLINGYHELENGLVVFGSGYWQEHFDFGIGLKTRKSALLGHGKAGEIVVNVILPFAFSWGEIADEPELKEKAINFYAYYPKLAENEITRHMARQLCLEDTPDFTACHQQGLIHIFRNYCREGRCSECPLAN